MTTDSFVQTLLQLLNIQSDLWEIIGLSLRVSITAMILAALLGLPLGVLLATRRFPGHRILTVLTNTMMGLPPVLVGLVVYLLLSRAGPLGVFGLLYTPTAMIIAQTLLITPIVASLSRSHLQQKWQRIDEQLRSLSITGGPAQWILLKESRTELGTVLLAGFGRAIAEIGAVMIAGGNIEHFTRVMTTAVALETSKGNLEMALALGLVLLVISLGVNMLVYGVSRAGVKPAL